MAMIATCETCRFWSGWVYRDEYEGECRRHAPRPVMYSQVTETDPATDDLTQWPLTRADDSCGEHQPKPQTAEEIQKAVEQVVPGAPIDGESQP